MGARGGRRFDELAYYAERFDTVRLLHTYPADYKLIFVGDASMSPYELVYPGGSVEHYNAEPGEVWLKRMVQVYDKAVWLNPLPEKYWRYTPSVEMVSRLIDHRMFPLTLDGLDRAMRTLSR